MRSFAYGSRLNDLAQGSQVWVYTYPGGTHSVSELSLSSDGTDGLLGRGGAHCSGGVPVPLCLQSICWFCAVPYWHGRQSSVWFVRTIAGCLSIIAFTLVCTENSTPRFFSSRNSVRGFLISCWVSSIVVRENPPLAIFARFNARRMWDCSSCTRPPCLAKVADMLKTYKKLVAASKVIFGYYLNHIRLCSLI